LLAPIIMPLVLFFVSGERIELDVSALIIDLLLMIVLPTVVAILANELTKGALTQRLHKPLAPFTKLCLFTVVAINSSAIAPYLKEFDWQFIKVILLVLVVAATGYLFAFLIGRFILKQYELAAAFLFTGGMRNIALGVVIATTYFPSKVAMP